MMFRVVAACVLFVIAESRPSANPEPFLGFGGISFGINAGYAAPVVPTYVETRTAVVSRPATVVTYEEHPVVVKKVVTAPVVETTYVANPVVVDTGLTAAVSSGVNAGLAAKSSSSSKVEYSSNFSSSSSVH
ncbi:hypothetical protein HHI36_020392 [Cryptolaemus montrouzieri]|uniref:Uncharacterized protein n=1 Tax=Cryptolaemus montrouzieri TaxID=559131 RepID=A0ABD2NAT6_9CUCU